MEETRQDLLQRTTNELDIGGIDNFVRESETILETVLKCSRNEIYLSSSENIGYSDIKKIDSIIKKRLSGIPLQYALGSTYFYSSNLKVTPSVLIPRPDTETLISEVLISETSEKRFFADIGTGSGAIALSLTNEKKSWSGIAVDISFEALSVAKENLSNKPIYSICSNSLSSILPEKQFDFIVSNPPYISSAEMDRLEASVLDFEPYKALFGGNDGLDFYHRFSIELPKYIKPDGSVYCEIGHLQGEAVKNIFKVKKWRNIRVIKDLGNRDRVISATVPEKTGAKCE